MSASACEVNKSALTVQYLPGVGAVVMIDNEALTQVCHIIVVGQYLRQVLFLGVKRREEGTNHCPNLLTDTLSVCVVGSLSKNLHQLSEPRE